MIKKFGSDVTVNVVASIIASVVFLIAGFFWGKYQEHQKFGKNLDQYDFYPFEVNRDNIPELKLNDFRLGMHYFLKNDDYTAARQLNFYRRAKQCPLSTRAFRAASLCQTFRKIRRQENR